MIQRLTETNDTTLVQDTTFSHDALGDISAIPGKRQPTTAELGLTP